MIIESAPENYFPSPNISRRNFIKWAAVIGGAGVLTAWGYHRAESSGGGSLGDPDTAADYNSSLGEVGANYQRWFKVPLNGEHNRAIVIVNVNQGSSDDFELRIYPGSKISELVAGADPEPVARPDRQRNSDGELTNTFYWDGGDENSGDWLAEVVYKGTTPGAYDYHYIPKSFVRNQ